MDTRRIGSLDVSVVGLGCNNFGRRIDRAQTQAVVDTALERGITLFDTADVYGDGDSEEYLGAALGSRRDEVIIATKFGMKMGDDERRSGASARWIRQAVEDSLGRLGTDRIDLYQLHGPDEEIPIEETLEALDELVSSGKVREVGCSNFDPDQLQGAAEAAQRGDWSRFVSVQNHFSLLHREPEEGVLQACAELDMVFIPYFPLASGVLTGKYRPGESPPEGSRLAGIAPDRANRFLNEENLKVAFRLQRFAEERGYSLLELAFSWLLSREVVASVIAGATKPDQVRANAAATGWQLSDQELAEIDAITSSEA